MSHHSSARGGIPALASSLGLLLFSLFASELLVHQLFSPLFAGLSPPVSGLVDSALLAASFALPLWLFLHRSRSGGARGKSAPGPARFFFRALLCIFLIHFLVMSFRSELLPGAGKLPLTLADALLALLFSALPLWWLFVRPEPERSRTSAAELLGTPLGIYALLLLIVSAVNLLKPFFLPHLFPDTVEISATIADSFVTTLVVSPLLWWLMARPLKVAAQSEMARSRAVQNQVIDAIVSIDAEGRIQSINPAAEKIFGYRQAEVAGQELPMLIPIEGQRLEELMQGAAASGGEQQQAHEIAGRRKDGIFLTLEVSVSKILLEDDEEFLLLMRDVSSRKEMENALRETQQRFRQIFEQIDDAIIFFKPGSCSVIDVNSTTEKIFGYSREEMKQVEVQNLVDCADVERLITAIGDVRPGMFVEVEQLTGRRKDGSEFVLTLRGKVMTLQGVEIVCCSFRDMTDRVRMEKEALDIQAKLIQANKMTSLGLMVSGVAHEINNPNNFIMANSHLLKQAWEDALGILREYYRENGEFSLGGIPFSLLEVHSPQLFAGIVDGSRRIDEIVKNLKGFVRQDRIVEGEVDINQVATSAASILHHELVRHTENFHMELGHIPRVKGSSQQLGQVIINLLMNACQALPARNCGILLTTGIDEAGRVAVSVRDEGCGISREESQRILEPFFTTKLDRGGTGLGLSISQSIVKEHRGVLEFVSEPGKGTTFTVRLPAAQSVDKELCG